MILTKRLAVTGNWIGVGTAIGAALFVLTDEPLWIALGLYWVRRWIGENPNKFGGLADGGPAVHWRKDHPR